MKKISRIIAFVLALSIVLAVCPVTSHAAGKNKFEYQAMMVNKAFKPLLSKQTGTSYPRPWSYKVYTLKLKNESVITIKRVGDEGNISIRFFKDKNLTKAVTGAYIYENRSISTASLKKGTYYAIFFCDEESDWKAWKKSKIKVNTYSVSKNNANYSPITAKTLKVKTKTEIVQTDYYNYDRWYKIKPTKSTINIKFLTLDDHGDFQLYDSNFKEEYYSVKNNTRTLYTADVVPGKTYYLRFISDDQESMSGRYISFKWY